MTVLSNDNIQVLEEWQYTSTWAKTITIIQVPAQAGSVLAGPWQDFCTTLDFCTTFFSPLFFHTTHTHSHTVASREIETTVFDPAVFLSTHWWSQHPASQFLPKETCNFYKKDIFRRFSAHPASGFLKHIVRNWPNPGCSFYVPVSMSQNSTVIRVLIVDWAFS